MSSLTTLSKIVDKKEKRVTVHPIDAKAWRKDGWKDVTAVKGEPAPKATSELEVEDLIVELDALKKANPNLNIEYSRRNSVKSLLAILEEAKSQLSD